MQTRTTWFQRLLGLLLSISLLNLNMGPAIALAGATNSNIATAPNAVVPEEMVLTKQHSIPQLSANPLQASAEVTSTATPPVALAAFAPFPAKAQTVPIQPLGQTATNLIQITDAGFNPATLNVFGPTDVTWVNNTNSTQILRSGTPGQNPGGTNPIFLPLIKRGSPSAVQAAAEYLQYLRRDAATTPDFSATLAPGQTFSYRFTTPGQTKFYLTNAPQFTGQLALTGTGLLRTSPTNGEDGVSATRETILEFSGPLDPASVTTTAFTARFGSEDLAYRLNLSPDKTRVTLFYTKPLPGSARVRVTVDGNTLKDAQGGGVDVDGDGAAGGSALLEFDTLSLTVVPGTSVCGRVFASELAVTASNVSVNTPLAGVTISVAGLEDALNTKTDANGNFCLNPAPSGRFFVHIDGHTATNNVPTGAYYPFVGKLWESTPGQQTSIGDAFLPLVMAGTLQPVSQSADTQIVFPDAVTKGHPEFNGVSVLVPANSLFNDDGERGGKVGIAPVPPDRLPGKLPPGLNFPVVITVQTDGAGNFDTPAPVCFPNLPDAKTGQPLAAGSKSALWSYDHDAGHWGVVGPMTVTSDGKLVCTDAGVGIRAPGWHGTQPGSTVTGGPIFVPEDAGACPEGQVQVCQDNPKWIPKDHVNGCGPEGWGGPVFSLLGADDPMREEYDNSILCSSKDDPFCRPKYTGTVTTTFKTACDNHDQHYGTCNYSKEQADNQFLTELLKVCSGLQGDPSDPKGIFYTRCNLLANYYYQLVHTEGKQPYTSAQTNACTCSCAPSTQFFGNASSKVNELESVPSLGLHYFAIMDRDTGEVILRGKAGANGIAHSLLTLSSNSQYRHWILQAQSLFDGYSDFATPDNGRNIGLPPIYLHPSNSWDFDADGLPDTDELIIGTQVLNPDTDGDGIPDGAEAQNGTDPLDGIAAQTGIIGSASTPGAAVDICVHNDLAVLAEGDKGISIFNVFDNRNPTIVAQIDTPGNAQRVACADKRVAVADGDNGLAIIDLSNLATPKIANQLNLNGKVTAVAIAGDTLYAGTATGRLVAVDLATGSLKEEVTLPATINDIAVSGDFLYVLTDNNTLHVIKPGEGLRVITAKAIPATQGTNQRLFAGTDLLYTTHIRGYNTFNLATPDNPTLLAAGSTAQFGWRQLVTNGARMGVAVSGVNTNTPRDIWLYDVSDPTKTDAFQTQFTTPGDAGAVALYKGLAYVADGGSGLQVINYLAYDNLKVAPTLSLATNFNAGKAEENALAPITAVTKDDVQVRGVEFYIDGNLAATDSSYPFEYRFTTPRLANQPSFRLRARAIDTGGNSTWSDEATITLVPDATPPRIIGFTPAEATNPAGSVNKVTVTFNEAVNPSTLTGDSIQVFAAGADNLLNTGDDVVVTGGTVTYDAATKTATLAYASALSAGVYRLAVKTTVTDLAGNALAKGFAHAFGVGALIPVGEIVRSTISVAAEQDRYDFIVAPGQEVYFDAIDSAVPYNFYWRLFDPNGKELFNKYLHQDDPGAYVLDLGGKYSLIVSANTNVTGAYQFQLRSVPPDQFNINIGDKIADGVPGVGAGDIELGGNKDVYIFQATAGQEIYFDDQGATAAYAFYWQLYDSSGKRLFSEWLNNNNDPGAYVLALGGQYKLVVAANANIVGTYQFQVRAQPPDQFAINFGDTVSNGNPGPGAGNIELAGNKDIYTFQANPGQEVYFDDQGATAVYAFYWRLYDSSGKQLFSEWLNNNNDPGAYVLALGGEYKIVVAANANIVGTYQFQVRAQLPDQFAINFGDTVSNGNPGPGAGNIELAGNKDVYTFQANPGQEVYFDDQGATAVYAFYWRLYDSSGKQLFSQWLNNNNDPGAYVLALGGQYKLVVAANNNVAGTYQFQVRAQSPDRFKINIGDTVSNGVPSAGAGNIELAGNKDIYNFQASAGQSVYFDDQGAVQAYSFLWRLTDPGGKELFNRWLVNSDPGALTLATTGTYTITVSANANIAGTYQFQIRPAAVAEIAAAKAMTSTNNASADKTDSVQVNEQEHKKATNLYYIYIPLVNQ